jgi:hypothetical protein
MLSRPYVSYIALLVLCSIAQTQQQQPPHKCSDPKTCKLTGLQAFNEAVTVFQTYKDTAGKTASFDDRSGISAAAAFFERAEQAHPDRERSPPNSAQAKQAGWGDVTWLKVAHSLMDVYEHSLDGEEQLLVWVKKLIAARYCDLTAQTQAVVEREYCWSGIFRNGILAARKLGREAEAKELFRQATSVELRGEKASSFSLKFNYYNNAI